MRQLLLLGGSLLLGAAGCGSEVALVGGPGGGSGGGATTSSSTSATTSPTTSSTSSTGGAGGYEPGCSVPTELEPPYGVTFRLTSVDGPVYVREECFVELSVTSCLDDYAQPLAIENWCTVDCATDPNGCVLCEQCLVAALPVDNDHVVDVPWAGYGYTFGTNAAGCGCSTAYDAPAAHYRLSVPVYATEEQALTGVPSWVAESDFTLPDPQGIVYLALTGI